MSRKISDLYNMLPFELTTGQKNFLSLATSGCNVLCQGSAGGGKSTVLQILKEYWGDSLVTTAMTGVANMRLFGGTGGTGTTARTMALPRGIAKPKDWKDLTKFCNEVMASSDRVEHIVVEECGSLSAEQMHLLQHRIKRFNKKSKKRRSRNIQLILCGDMLQLGTITSDEEKEFFTQNYGSHLFFKSDAFKQMDFKVVYLNEVKRQSDKVFMASLDILRYGNTDRMTKMLEWLNRRYTKDLPENVPRICSSNKAVNAFNIEALRKNLNQLYEYTPDIEGEFNYEDNCPVDFNLEVKEGMVAMTLINHEDGLYQNGSVGIVTQCTAAGVWIRFNETNEEILVEPFEFVEYHDVEVSRTKREDGTDHVEYETEERGRAFHVPICHAAAISVHKSQGATIPSAYVIDFGSTWAFENHADFGQALAYVAFSRATCINNVYLKTKIKKEHVKVCKETIFWLIENEAIEVQQLSKRMLAEYKRSKGIQ